MSATTADPAPAAQDPTAASRRARLLAGLDAVANDGNQSEVTSRTMRWAAMLAGVGLATVLLGWFGASRTPNLHEQIPYMISGGLFGLGLCFLGGSAYFAHWVSAAVREQRENTAQIVRAVSDLGDRLERSLAGVDEDASR